MESGWNGDERRRGQPADELGELLRQLQTQWAAKHTPDENTALKPARVPPTGEAAVKNTD